MSIPPQAYQIMEQASRALQRQIIDAAVAEFKAKLSGSFTASGQVSASSLGGTVPTTSLPDLAGDAEGPPGANTVVKVQGRPFDATVPALGDVPTWDGDSWAPTAPAASGAPTDATYVVRTANGTLSAEVLLSMVEAHELKTRYEPLTNGDTTTPELIFAAGDCVMVEVPI